MKKKNGNNYNLRTLGKLLLIVAGCITIFVVWLFAFGLERPFSVDTSLINFYPCKLPCWYNLQVGQSTYENVIDQIHWIPIVPLFYYTAEVKYVETDQLTEIYWPNTTSGAGSFVFDHYILQKVEFSPNVRISVRELINIYGLPECVEIYKLPVGDILSSYLSFYMSYPKYGLLVEFVFPFSDENYFDVPQEQTYRITVTLFRPGLTIEQFFAERSGGAPEEQTRRYIKERVIFNWNGVDRIDYIDSYD